jgi:ATP synthase protein I
MTPAERRDSQPNSTNAAWSIVSYLLSGMAVWGGAGWLLDRWAGLDRVFFPIGLIVGIIAALYLVYVRYGRS